MNKILLNRKDGNTVEAEFKELDLSYINKIMELQDRIYNGLINKDFYACSEKEEFEKVINENGKIIGCVSLENDELIAMGVYVEYGYEEHNYGYDLEFKGEQLLKVGQVESTVVSEEYRGNKLQRIICEKLEKISSEAEREVICSTVAPENKFSLNTFIKLGYEIKLEKLKYGGLRRYVLMKRL